MKKETIVYTDYNGVERKEDFFFNFTKAELLEMELGTTGGLSEMIQKIIDTHDTPAIIKIFKEIVLKAYGQKSPDGKRFIKTPELTTEFMQTEAYSTLFMELATNTDKAADFINKIVPQDMAQKATPSASVPVNN